MPPELQSLLSEALKSRGTRSTALQSIMWLVGILVGGCFGVATWAGEKAEWLLVVLAVLLCISLVVFLVAFIYFMLKNPDALRSEKFAIEKLYLEKHLVGDQSKGLVEVAPIGTKPNQLVEAEPNV